jgi:hypothetical protein
MGLGGLAAQAPLDVYFPQALGITSQAVPLVGSQPAGVIVGGNVGNQQAGGLMSPGTVSASGTAARVPVSRQQRSWSSVLDFHNSTAPWILIAILLLYGWLHVSFNARAGKRASIAATV